MYRDGAVRAAKPALLALLVIMAYLLDGCGQSRGSFLKERDSDYNITQSAKRFSSALAQKNYRVLYTIDQEREAAKGGEYLYPTLTLEINNPRISGKLISCNPTMALEMPIRVAIYNRLDGSSHLVYTNPEYWSLKHNIRDKECIGIEMQVARDLDEARDSIKKGER